MESDVEVVGAKLGLQNGQRTLRELTCLLQLRPPPQVASRLIQQVGGQGPLGFQNGSVLGRDQGMGQQPGTGRPGLHIVFRERGPEQGAVPNHKNPRAEPPDHAIGRSRGGLTCKVHLVVDGKGRPLSWALTGGNVNDTTMMTAVLDDIRVPRKGKGRPRTRPDRVLADKGYPSKANRTWLRTRGIAATIPERDDQIAHRKKKPGRPIDFGEEQKRRYRGRNVVERCFNRLKQWRGIAMRTDKLARNYRAAICLSATLIWIKTDSINTA